MGYGGLLQTQRHHWLIHWPFDNGAYQWQLTQVTWLVRRLGNYFIVSTSEPGWNNSSIYQLNIIAMDILQGLYGKSEMILFPMIVVFLMKPIAELDAKISSDVKYERFIFQVLPNKHIVSLKSLFWYFPHLSIFMK